MLKNYLKIAVRSLLKNKTYSFVNIFGLSVGVACCLLILLYLTNEFSYDRFHENSDRIYRASVLEDYGDGDIYWNTITPLRFKNLFEEYIPETELVARRYIYSDLVRGEDRSESFSEPIQLVDPEFFRMFDFELLEGVPSSVFSQPSNVVLTPTSSKRFFGTENSMGEILLIKMGNDFKPFTVAGIIEEAPTNSSIQYELLIPFQNATSLFSAGAFDAWYSVVPETYVQLVNGANSEEVRAKLTPLAKQLLGEEEWNRSQYSIDIQPLTDIHLNPDMPTGIASVSDPTYLYILAGIALLVLLIACVNFITLSISRSGSRAKEIGVRKTIGAERTHVMYQFWGEALLMTLLSLVIALLLTETLLPYFNQLSGTSLVLGINFRSVAMVIFFGVIVSVVAGIYPALFLSRFKPIEVLKGRIHAKKEARFFRTGMVVFQFTISIFLIASTMIIGDQLDFLRSKSLGYQNENIIVLQIDDNPDQETGFTGLLERTEIKAELLRSELNSIPEVNTIATSMYTPADNGWISVDYRDTQGKVLGFNVNFVGLLFPKLLDLTFTEGRDFSEEITTDAQQAIIVNEAFVDLHGWDDPLNAQLHSPEFIDHEIIGVVENFNYSSLRNEVEPLAIVISPIVIFSGIDNVGLSSTSPKISVSIESNDIPATIASLETAWNKVSPGEPFNFNFLDQAVDAQYRQEERLAQIISFGATFAVIIACMGLFGLASLMVIRRTKEIGVRKVLGASATRILILVNKEFSLLVLYAVLLAAPIIWFGMNSWLNDFAYRIPINFWTIALSGLMALIIAWLTIGIHLYKAATVNPVESLKSE